MTYIFNMVFNGIIGMWKKIVETKDSFLSIAGNYASVIGLFISAFSLLASVIERFMSESTGWVFSFFVVMFLLTVLLGVFAVKHLKKKDEDTAKLTEENRFLKGQRQTLTDSSCFFIPRCNPFGGLKQYLGKDNGYFENPNKVWKQIETCDKCSEKRLKTKENSEQFEDLKKEVEGIMNLLNKQPYTLYVIFYEEQRDLGISFIEYFAQKGIICEKYQGSAMKEIARVVRSNPDKKVFFVLLFCDNESIRESFNARIKDLGKSNITLKNQSQNNSLGLPEFFICAPKKDLETLERDEGTKRVMETTPIKKIEVGACNSDKFRQGCFDEVSSLIERLRNND